MAPSRFRWIFCQLDALRQCLPSSLRRTLAELPESLDETYERIVMDIKKGNREDAYRMLQCIAVAIRPLSVAELAELLAFDFDATQGGIPKLNSKWRWDDHEQAVLSTCSSLITIVPDRHGSPVVQFSHFSVKEFLMSDRLATLSKDISQYHIIPEAANTLIARASLGVLLRDPVDEHGAATAPLARYAAQRWVAHARVENVASRIRDGMESLFDPDQPYFSAWVKLYDIDRHLWDDSLKSKIRPEAAPLYYAALCGFHEIVEHLSRKHPQYANAISGRAGTALHSASNAGHIEVVRSLLKCGVRVDARGVVGLSPLHLASIRGHLHVVRCLLDHGANPNFRSAFHTTPLSYATAAGHLEIVLILLERNVDVDTQNKDGSTPLHRLISCYHSYPKDDHSQVARLLLERGANPNTQDNKRRTPLHLVMSDLKSSSRLEISRILLAHGADVDAEDKMGKTPFQVALANKEGELVQLFSEYRSK